jgi:hypothetical protein
VKTADGGLELFLEGFNPTLRPYDDWVSVRSRTKGAYQLIELEVWESI